jgi:hypothetical protein
MTLLTLLTFVLFQDPAPAPLRLDEVELVGGEVLQGRIVCEVGNYLEIELEPGATVGFRTSMVAAVRRGAGPVVEAVRAPLPAHDEWFALHDGTGAAVGWLHSTARALPGGGVRVQEEWEFRSGTCSFQVTALEIADAELRPQSCYFRERVQRDRAGTAPVDALARATQVLEERIVEARVDGQELVVHRLTADGRSERRLRWPEGATFPQLARKAQGREAQARECTVFDAAAEELQVRTFGAGRRRSVELGGVPTQVEETVEAGNGGTNVIWRDASARIVHREVAGPALVAVPCDEEHARATGHIARPSPFVPEPGHRFGLWVPNPAWNVQPAAPGAVSLRHGTHDATIALVLLDHLGEQATLDAAAAAVERMATLVYPDLVVDERQVRTVRGHDAVRLGCRGSTVRATGRAALWVVPWQRGFLVLRCSAKADCWDELLPDFDAVVQRLELAPAAVAALLRDGAPGAQGTEAAPAATADAAPRQTHGTGRVRVPRDDGR